MRDPRFYAGGPWERQSPPSEETITEATNLAHEIVDRRQVDFAAIGKAWTRFGYGTLVVWHAFYDTLTNLIIADEPLRDAWVRTAQNAVLASANEIEGSAKHREARHEAGAWRTTVDPFFIWQRPGCDPYRDAPIWEFDLLLLLDKQAWFGTVDGLSLPSLTQYLVWVSPINSDRELLLELLEHAPAVFDDQGDWTRSIAGLLVTDEILGHAQRLHQTVTGRIIPHDDQAALAEVERNARALEHDELPAWFKSAYEVLLRRSDGRFIAYGLLDKLSRRVLQGQDSIGKRDWFPEGAAFDALIDVLVQAGATVAEIRDFCEQRSALKEREKKEDDSNIPRIEPGRSKRRPAHFGEGRRSFYFEAFSLAYAAACILDRAAASPEQASGFWSWFSELLERRVPGIGMAIHNETQVHALEQIGKLLARLPSPHAAWEATYRKLEPQRRRQLALLRYEDQDADEPTVVLVRMGLACCAVWVQQEPSQNVRQDIRSFFWRLYEVARRLWLTATDRSNDSPKMLVALCFAFIPEIFGEDLSAAVARAVAPIATDPRLLALAACYLRVNQVEPLRIAGLFSEAGADLVAALRDAHQWSELTGLQDEFPPHFQELSDALGISFDEPEAPESDEDRLRRHRALFPKYVAWGDALLRRLALDGCTPTRIDPLHDTGTAWLIQARLPQLLSDTFALAPEVRIVAATGWFDGSELGRVREDALRAEEVDPDFVVLAYDRVELADKLSFLPGPWGQRIPWPVPEKGDFPPLADQIRAHAADFDLFNRLDPIQGRQIIGRKDMMDDLGARLARGQAVGVFGLRKVGKSSLLYAVAEKLDPIAGRRALFASAAPIQSDVHALVVFVDVQGIPGRTLGDVTRAIARALRVRLDAQGMLRADFDNPRGLASLPLTPPDAEPNNDPMLDLEQLLRIALTRSSLPIGIILDEYDLLFEGYGGEAGTTGIERLFGLLRSLAQQTRRISVAVIGRDPMFFERPLMGGFTNPMLGWSETLWLGPLRRGEADELLSRLGKRVGLEVGPTARELGWVWTGGHPVLLRQYGSALLEIAHKHINGAGPLTADSICRDAIKAFRDRDAVHTIVSEIRALFAARYPHALDLLYTFAASDGEQDGSVLHPHGGWDGEPARILRKFGVLIGSAGAPRVAEILRYRLARTAPIQPQKRRRRNVRHGLRS